MATGGSGLKGTDPVKDDLLSHVSNHVISETRIKFYRSSWLEQY